MIRRWALFLSGRGSTAQSALECLPGADVRVVVSGRKSAYGLKRARQFGVPEIVLPKDVDWDALALRLKALNVNSIFLLGFMRIVPESFISQWNHQIFNLHPSLLPDFKGAHGMRESYDSKTHAMGVSVHHVTVGMDEGPLKLQTQVFTAQEKQNLTWDQARLRIAITEQRLVRRMLDQAVIP